MIVPSLLNLVMKSEERDARLDQARVIIWIDVQDLVHPFAKIDQDRTPDAGRRSAITH